jgi:glucan-binding YG repeat protein
MGTDGRLYHNWYPENGHWAYLPNNPNWESFQIPPTNQAPAVAYRSGMRLDVFLIDTNGNLRHNWYPENGHWAYLPNNPNWESFQVPPTNQAPAVVASVPNNRLDVFLIDTNGNLRHNWYPENGHWAYLPNNPNWESFVATSDRAPAAVSWGSGRIDIFCRGSSGDIHHKWYEGSWQPIPFLAR